MGRFAGINLAILIAVSVLMTFSYFICCGIYGSGSGIDKENISNIGGFDECSLTGIGSWAYQLQKINLSILPDSDVFVMDYSYDGSENGEIGREDIEMLKRNGVIPIAYISIGEAEDYRFYWNESWHDARPDWIAEENNEWRGNYAVRYWRKEWRDILKEYVDRIIDAGFEGLYLDKLDEFEYWGHEIGEENSSALMADLIREIADYSRNRNNGCFYIIPQNGERILAYDPSLADVVSGWAVEDLFYDGTTKREGEEWNDVVERIGYLKAMRDKGKPVFVVDYVDDGSGSEENARRIEDFIKISRSYGFIPYPARSDRELDSINSYHG